MAKNVLFVTHKLQRYRIPIFLRIIEDGQIILTIAHSGKTGLLEKDSKLNELVLEKDKIGPLFFFKKDFTQLVSQFDAVVCMFYLNNLRLLN